MHVELAAKAVCIVMLVLHMQIRTVKPVEFLCCVGFDIRPTSSYYVTLKCKEVTLLPSLPLFFQHQSIQALSQPGL